MSGGFRYKDKETEKFEFVIANAFLDWLESRGEQPSLIEELKDLVVQFYAVRADAKSVPPKQVLFRMAGLNAIERFKHTDERVVWRAGRKALGSSGSSTSVAAAASSSPVSSADVVRVVQEIVEREGGHDVPFSRVLAAYNQQTGRLLKTDLNVPSWGDHFAGLAEFVVIKDKKGQKNGKFFSLSLKSVVDKLEQDKSAPSSDKGKEEMKEDEQNNERRQPLRRYSADDAVPPSVPGNAPLPEASRWHDKSASTTLVQKEDEDVFMPVVSTVEECESACKMLKLASKLAVLVKGAVGSDGLSLIQIASSDFVFFFDMLSPDSPKFKDHGLASLLESPSGLLLVCDCVNCVRLLKKGGFNPSNVMDVTLLYSTVRGGGADLDLGHLVKLVDPAAAWVRFPLRFWMNRPLSTEQKEVAGLEVTSLFDAAEALSENIPQPLLQAVLARSLEQLNKGDKKGNSKKIQRFMSAPLENRNQSTKPSDAGTSVDASSRVVVASAAAAAAVPAARSPAPPTPQSVPLAVGAANEQKAPQQSQQQVPASKPVSAQSSFQHPFPSTAAPSLSSAEIDALFAVLPPRVAGAIPGLLPGFASTLSKIMFDLGRPFSLLQRGDPTPLRSVGTDPITEKDLAFVAEKIGGAKFRASGVAGIQDSLHCVFGIFDGVTSELVGLTIRIVSAVPGASELVQDLIVSGRSMLVLGPGAAAVLRDAAAGAALSQTVCVVDTRGELGGLGLSAHSSLGVARRMRPGKDGQRALLRAAIDHHAARLLVVDELRSEEDFAEAMAGKTRGVQVLAGCPARTTTELVNARRTLFEFDCVVQLQHLSAARVYYVAEKYFEVRKKNASGVIEIAREN